MKKLLLSCVLFILSTCVAEAQWKMLDLPFTSYTDIAFPAQNRGFLVGDNGLVLKTTNEGNSWETIETGTKAKLTSIHFPTSQVGYIAGDSGAILKTMDGGQNWQILKFEHRNNSIISVTFVTENIGFIETAVNGNDSLTGYRTKDGGLNWAKIYTGGNIGVSFISPAIGFRDGRSEGMYKTIDSGATWMKIESKNHPSRPSSTIFFLDEQRGFFGGGYHGILFASTLDGGQKWTWEADMTGTMNDNSGNISGISDFSFPSKNIGYAIEPLGQLLKTRDGGKSWTILKERGNWLGNNPKAFFVNENIGYVVSDDRVLKTTTGGEEPVSIYEPLLKTISLNISPNPFKNSTQIEFPENILKSVVKIFTANGEECSDCFKSEIIGNSVIIERKTAAVGMYYYTIESEGKVVAEGKFVVE